MNASDKPVWHPTAAQIRQAALTRFAQDYAPRDARRDYHSLHRWSVTQPQAFWSGAAEFTGVCFDRPPHATLVGGEHMAEARWFPGATLNYAEHLLRLDLPDPALIALDERGRRREFSRADLRMQVLQVAGGLHALGVGPGDRVAAVLPNCPEAVIAYLAAAAIGAVFSSCSPDFGAQAAGDRFSQIAPRVLIGCDGYTYGGKRFECRAALDELREVLPGEVALFVVPFLDAESTTAGGDARPFADLLAGPPVAGFAALPFDHPLCILFSSGTTGEPKCIVHRAGGVLLQHLKEQVLHTDLGPGDRLLYFTTCGWMMWNWLVSGLATGATVVLYDGAPACPTARGYLQLSAAEGVSVFGTSPRFLTTLAKQYPQLGSELRWPQLRTVLSTGAPLPAASFDFVAAELGSHVQLASISGGTDIISCFVLGNPWLPVHRGEIQCAGLGMAVDVFDGAGMPLSTGAGELVCTEPFPSMPLGFWGDHGQLRFRSAYFDRYPGVWFQGDLAGWTGRGGIRVLGRSDTTLNPGGVRIGTAEVCGPALAHAAVIDALAVGHRHHDDERVILFVVLTEGAALTPALQQEIAERIRTQASPRHVPAQMFAVPAMPQTRSGKSVELAVRAVLHGADPGNLDGVANPEALEAFVGLI